MFFRKLKDSSTPPDRHLGGESIFIAILTCIIISVMGVSLTRLHNASFMSLVSSETSMQAQHFAKSKMDYLMFKGYNNLVTQAKTAINGTTFKDSVALGTITTDADGVKKRTVTVSVYNGDEASPRATLSHVFYSNDADLYVRNGSSPTNSISMHYEDGKLLARVDGTDVELGAGVPVGTVIAWVSTTNPTKGGVWLECNGQSCAKYPELVALLGKNTVPDMRNRFLEGYETPNQLIEAGLPNISGRIISDDGAWPYTAFAHGYEGQNTNRFAKGCFFVDSYTSVTSIRPQGISGSNQDRADGALAFEASRSNPIYGASETVQPPAYTVRYYIKAA